VANYFAAILIVAAVALFVAAPLSGGFPRRWRATSRELDFERLEHERGLAVQGLLELEFDHEMGKLDELDYRKLKKSLEDRALAAMSAIERARITAGGTKRGAPMRLAARGARSGRAAAAVTMGVTAPAVNFCPQCGVRVGAGHNFCAACGASVNLAAARVAARGE
jgi:ribosomal protein L32